MTLSEKTAYLKGLAEGLAIDVSTPEGKIITAMLDVIAEMSQTVAGLETKVGTLNDYIEEIDEDLGEVEEYICDLGDDSDKEDDDEHECGCCCDECGTSSYEALCPNCNETIYFDDDMEIEDLVCSHCGQHFIETDDCDCECGCGGCHHDDEPDTCKCGECDCEELPTSDAE